MYLHFNILNLNHNSVLWWLQSIAQKLQIVTQTWQNNVPVVCSYSEQQNSLKTKPTHPFNAVLPCKKSCSIDKQKLLNARPCLTSESHLLLMKLRIFFRGPRGIPNSFRSLSWQRALKGKDINREMIKHCLWCCLKCARLQITSESRSTFSASSISRYCCRPSLVRVCSSVRQLWIEDSSEGTFKR